MKEFTIREIAGLFDGEVYGDTEVKIKGVSEIDKAKKGEITFLSNQKYKKFLQTTEASCIIVTKINIIEGKNLIVVKDPYLAFALLVKLLYAKKKPSFSGISPESKISESAKIENDVNIGPFCSIGENVTIGEGTSIYPNVFIDENTAIGKKCIIYSNVSIRENSSIGNDVIIHSGAVIGSDGFGFVWHEDKYEKIPQVGRVIIEDEVEIGANCCIDRAAIGETVIKKGAKLDNLIQVAHNVVIGENTAIAAQAGISGSTKIGKFVQVGGQAGFAGHIEVGDGVKIGGQAGITKSVPDGIYVTGTPARPFMEQRRLEAVIAKLPKLYKKLLNME
ncbi:UDP-3-O-(3-hydroxymyristoyl)glucosamine N-acyltransferase [candidate division KSB1 bacterium]